MVDDVVSSEASGPSPGDAGQLSLLPVLLRNLPKIVLCTLAAALIAGALASTRPDRFTARTLLFQSQTSQSPAQSLAGRIPGGALMGLGGGPSSTQLVELLLRSRSLSEALRERVGSPTRSSVDQQPDGSILVQVVDSDPERAAAIANTYSVVLNELIAKITLESSERRENLLQRQITDARERLEAVEGQLLTFEQSRGGGAIAEQTAATVSAAVELQREILENEVRISQLRRTATLDNPALQAALAENEARRAQLRRLQSGGSGSTSLPSLQASSELRIGATRILRDYAEAEQVYSTLRAALAADRMEVHTAMPAVEVLDPAITPTQPTPVNLRLIVMVAALLALITSIAVILVQEYVRHARLTSRHAEFFAEWDRLKGRITRRGIPLRS